MKYFIFFLVFFLGFFPVQGATFYEATLKELGYMDFSITGFQQEKCQNISFTFPENWEQNPEILPIVSFNITTIPSLSGPATITLQLNDFNITSFAPETAVCSENGCWKHVTLSKKKLKEKENNLSVCARTSEAINTIIIHNTSFIGLYTVPLIKIVSIPEKSTAIINNPLSIVVSVQNEGSESATIRIQRARAVAADKNVFRVIGGKTSWDGTISPHSVQEIAYTIIPLERGLFSLPPAIVFFKGLFGENKFLFADPVPLLVVDPPDPLEARIFKQVEITTLNKPVDLSIVLKNNMQQKIGPVTIKPSENITPVSGFQDAIFLEPLETKTLHYSFVSQVPGSFTIGCSVYAPGFDANIVCAEQAILVEEEKIPLVFILGFLFFMMGIGIYLFIRFAA